MREHYVVDSGVTHRVDAVLSQKNGKVTYVHEGREVVTGVPYGEVKYDLKSAHQEETLNRRERRRRDALMRKQK